MARSKYEIKAQKMLEADGYEVDYKIRPRFVPRNYNVDYFNLFDLLAINKTNRLRAISIKGVETSLKDHKEALVDFVQRYMPDMQCELWRFVGGIRKPPKIYIITRLGVSELKEL